MDFSTLFRYCPVCGSSGFVVNDEKSMRCKTCGFIFYTNASASVAAFIQNEQGELLVCKRAKEPAKGTLDLPGGFVDYNETVEEAVKREIKEELNGEIAGLDYLFSLPNEYMYSGMTIPTIDMFFLCHLTSLEGLYASDDVADFEFIPLNDINPEEFGLNSIRKAIAIFLATKSNIL